MSNDIADRIADHMVNDHIELMNETKQLRDQLDEAQRIAMTNKELAENLLNRLAASAAREGILRETVRLNHEFIYERIGDYCDPQKDESKIRDTNIRALELPDDDTALKIVMANRDPIEGIRHFNKLAGNTDDQFNVRQAAMYTGLQLEEMAEKLTTIFGEQSNDVDERFFYFAEAMDQYGMRFKKGEFDHLLAKADRTDLLDDDCDQFVVTIGSMLSMGVGIHGALAEVNRSNMSKVFDDGTLHRNEHGKIIKSPAYSEPNLDPFICNEVTS